MQKATLFYNKVSLLIMCCACLVLCSCNPKDSTDLAENSSYPHKYPDLTAKSSYPSVEKPDIEEEFFEADKH
jgi:hypothetical protein